MHQLSEDDSRMLKSLQLSVTRALERKYRLGQYAIIWRDGRPQRVEGEELGRLCGHAPYPGVQDRPD
jgi:hypothetical protein